MKFRLKYRLITLFLVLVPVTAAFAEPAPWANYTVTLQSTWSAATHPDDFPSNPHYSSLVGGTHNADVTFWAPGGLATTGVQQVAEWGSSGVMLSEVAAAINAGDAGEQVNAGGIAESPGMTSGTFTITPDHPLITLLTMIAPSPDWIIGVSGLNLLAGDQWADEISVDLYPYDVGTDSGSSYGSPNQPTTPHEAIALIDGFPFAAGVPLGTLTFQLNGSAAAGLPSAQLALTAQPNPFNPATVLHYELPVGAQNARLAVYDPRGRLVRQLVTASGAGMHQTRWDGRTDNGKRAATGVYFAHLDVDGVVAVQKVALVK